MKVFVAGATGVLGRRVVAGLRARGHAVAALARSPENEIALRAAGAEPRRGDLFDRDAMRELTQGCDVVAHLATSIPRGSSPSRGDWAVNDRIRRQGTEILVDAALANGAGLYIQESVTFLYGDRRGAWVDESAEPSPRLIPALESAVDMERIVGQAVRARGLRASILRFGGFYAEDSSQTRMLLELTSQRRFPVLGRGTAYWNLIHLDDAAAAVVKAAEAGPRGAGTFHVCDDEPVTARVLLDHLAALLGAKRPIALPAFLAKWMAGRDTIEFFLASVRCRNDRVKQALGWAPRHPTYREGMAAVVAAWKESR
jgi:nucleoside-diphosphate-sugar epimerase